MSIAAQLRQGNAGKVVGGMKQLGLFGFKAISASRHVAEMRLNDVAVAEKEEAEKLARSERAIARKEELAAKVREIRKRMREGGRPGLSDDSDDDSDDDDDDEDAAALAALGAVAL